MLKVVVLLSVLACATAANVIVLVGAGTRDNLNNGFPQHTKIDAGDCVVWQNKGKGVHAVKAADGSFESAMLFVNDEFKHCFAEEGAFEIIDPLHAHNANMDAKSVVLVGSAAANAYVAPPQRNRLMTNSNGNNNEASSSSTSDPFEDATTAQEGVIMATNAYLQSEQNLIDAFTATSVVIRAEFEGEINADARAYITDGINTIRSNVVTATADQSVSNLFGPMDVRSLQDGALRIGIEVIGRDAFESDAELSKQANEGVRNPYHGFPPLE